MLSLALEAALSNGRAAAEARMTSRCTIRRPQFDGQGRRARTPDAQGYDVDAWSVVATGVPLRIDEPHSSGVSIGGVFYEQATALDHLPATQDLRDLDCLDVTSGEWVGTVHRVVKAIKGDQKTARRVPVEEVSRPEEWT